MQKRVAASATQLDLGSAAAPNSSGKALYRDDKPAKSNNIMYDKRVVRGSTYAMPVIPPVSLFYSHHLSPTLSPTFTNTFLLPFLYI